MPDYAIFNGIINGNTSGFIKDWDIVSEGESNNIYCVEVKPVVELRDISVEDVEAIRLMIELMNDPRIFISIKEYVNDEESDKSIAAHTIKSIIGCKDNQPMYHIVDSVENAEIVIFGESRLVSIKPDLEDFAGSNFLSCNSEIDISIKIRDTEKCSLENTNKNISLPQNINDITRSCAEKLATKLISKLLLCIQPTIKLIVHNLDSRGYNTFHGLIKKIQNVENVFLRSYKETTGIYDVHTSGTLNEFLHDLQIRSPDINIIAASSSQIEIKM